MILKSIALLLATVALPLSSAQAANLAVTGNPILDDVLATLLYSVIGICMAFFSYKVIDLITPGHLSRDIAENNNTALAILAGCTVLGICIIIAAVLVG